MRRESTNGWVTMTGSSIVSKALPSWGILEDAVGEGPRRAEHVIHLTLYQTDLHDT